VLTRKTNLDSRSLVDDCLAPNCHFANNLVASQNELRSRDLRGHDRTTRLVRRSCLDGLVVAVRAVAAVDPLVELVQLVVAVAHVLDLIIYCGLGLFKLFVFIFYLFPWIAIRMVLKKANG
jgi:hypothetical protein